MLSIETRIFYFGPSMSYISLLFDPVIYHLTDFFNQLFINSFGTILFYRFGIPAAADFFHFEPVISMVVNGINDIAIFRFCFEDPDVDHLVCEFVPEVQVMLKCRVK